jgi:2-hydroxy-3-oxopropionate reductase
MALNLAKGGHELFTHSRSGVPADVTAAGATACGSAREVAEQAEVVITMVPTRPTWSACCSARAGWPRAWALARP